MERKRTKYYQVGKSAAAFQYDKEGSLYIHVLRPGATDFVLDPTLWGEVYFRDDDTKLLTKKQFEKTVSDLNGNTKSIPA